LRQSHGGVGQPGHLIKEGVLCLHPTNMVPSGVKAKGFPAKD
jgi:hypothetical protein